MIDGFGSTLWQLAVREMHNTYAFYCVAIPLPAGDGKYSSGRSLGPIDPSRVITTLNSFGSPVSCHFKLKTRGGRYEHVLNSSLHTCIIHIYLSISDISNVCLLTS